MKVFKAAVLGLALVLWSPLGATDFIRGDLNGDGVVSLSDAHFLRSNLGGPHGLIPQCLNSADVDDNGSVDVDDLFMLVHYLGHSLTRNYPRPFPEAGPDPTPNLDQSLTCSSYGGGSPLPDPEARIEVLEATCPGGPLYGAPGQGEVGDIATFTLGITNSTPIAGYSGRISCEDLFGFRNGGLIVEDLTGTNDRSWFQVQSLFTPDRRNEIEFLMLNDYYDTRTTHWIPPGEHRPAFRMQMVLKPGVKKGDYPLTLEVGELVDGESGRRIVPTLVSGTLRVLADLAPEAGCRGCVDPSLDPDYVPPPNPPHEVVYRLGDASGRPGDEVTLPFTMRLDAPGQGYSFSLDFDEEVLQAEAVESVFSNPDGSAISFEKYDFNNEDATPGNAGVDEGFVWGAAVFNFDQPDQLPPDQDNRLLELHFRVKPDAVAVSTDLRFMDGARGPDGRPVTNTVSIHGRTYTPETVPSFVFLNGRVNIIPDGIPFVRGDSNRDLKVDLSDALFTLSYLFLAGSAPACLDAADANDDGTIDIADPITILAFLFQDGEGLPPPRTAPAPDPTEDLLGCSGK